MEGKINLVIVDGRHSTFKKRPQLNQIVEGVCFSTFTNSTQIDENALKFLQTDQKGFKYYFVYPTQNPYKLNFYNELKKQHEQHFKQSDNVQFLDVSQKELKDKINSIISNESETHSLESITIISHNLDKLTNGLVSPNKDIPIFKILFSGYSQDYIKKRKLEEHSYSKNNVSYHLSTIAQIPSAINFLHKQNEEQKKNPETKQIIYNVGYYFDYAKMNQMNVYNLLNASYPYKYTPLDFKLPYTGAYPPYGLQDGDSNTVQFLVHKFQDFYKDKSEQAQEMIKKQEQHFNDFIQKYSGIVHMIDDTSKQDKIRNRIDFNDEMLRILETDAAKKVTSKFPEIFISTPKILPFDPKTQQLSSFIEEIEKNLQFPILVKAVEATSSKESHFMAIVHNIQSLNNFLTNNPIMSKISVIVQEMINHDGRINKLYVIGNHTEMQVRVSIPNIDVEQYKGDENAFWTFDSQKSFKEQLPIKIPDKLDNPNTTLNPELIWELSQVIRNHFSLNLFGYDIVQRTGTQQYYIVDLNYFPGFKNFVDVIGKFRNLYQDLISRKNKITN